MLKWWQLIDSFYLYGQYLYVSVMNLSFIVCKYASETLFVKSVCIKSVHHNVGLELLHLFALSIFIQNGHESLTDSS